MTAIHQNSITRSAKGEECTVRLPGICTLDTETTVLCHLDYLEFRKHGRNGKSCDVHSFYGCRACHEVSGNTQLAEHLYSPQTIKLYVLEAVLSTQLRFIEKSLMWWGK